MPPLARDPVSVLFDAGARQLLERAYANPGTWQGTRLADPDRRHVEWGLALGINVLGPDSPSVRGGRRAGLNARTRWCRGFVRALYYQHRWYSTPGKNPQWRDERRLSPRSTGALQVEIGRALPVRGVIPAGRAVRIRLAAGGQAKQRAARALPEGDRIWADDGEPGGRFSYPDLRDWA